MLILCENMISFPDCLGRYSALVGIALIGATSAHAANFSVFDAPYATGILSTDGELLSDNTVSGAWTWDIIQLDSGFAGAAVDFGNVLEMQVYATTSPGNTTVEFRTTIVSGFDSVSFNYDAVGINTYELQWFKNGTTHTLTGVGSISSTTFSPGDTFGFRLSATYGLEAGAALLRISNLTATSAAPVPEPASAATWLGLGVAGFVTLREMRRRPRASAQA